MAHVRPAMMATSPMMSVGLAPYTLHSVPDGLSKGGSLTRQHLDLAARSMADLGDAAVGINGDMNLFCFLLVYSQLTLLAQNSAACFVTVPTMHQWLSTSWVGMGELVLSGHGCHQKPHLQGLSCCKRNTSSLANTHTNVPLWEFALVLPASGRGIYHTPSVIVQATIHPVVV